MAITLRGADSVYDTFPPAQVPIPATTQSGDLGVLSFCGQTSFPAVPPVGWTLVTSVEYSASMTMWVWSKTMDVGEASTELAVETEGSTQKSGVTLVVLGGAGTVLAFQSAMGGNTSPAVAATGDRVHLSFWHQRGGTENLPGTIQPPATLTLLDEAMGTGGGQVSSAVAGDLTTTAVDLAAGSWTTTQTNAGTIVVNVAVEVLAEPPASGNKIGIWNATTQTIEPLSPHVWEASTETMAPLTIAGVYNQAPPAGLVDTLIYPVIAAHRGGADEGPQNTMTAFDLIAPGNPGTVLECDVQLNADQMLVMAHDTTVNGTPVASITDAQWATLTQEWPAWFENPPAPRSWWHELATAWGGTNILMPEMKGSDPDVVDALVGDILSRGLERDVILQSFNFSFASEAALAGIETCYLTNTPNYPNLISAGIGHIGVEKGSATAQLITDAHAQGLKVWVYTVNSVSERDALIGLGADGIFTNKPTTLGL
ncbi:hypothetical protein CQ010_01590 [Arthrobacter sp. MYb211]|uniref:glycerophosphodiester phosphodiesterase n=1 Tax=unclassified Arthrobacter TaxID=235627 RepID=UPI000CFC0B6E|nr:MULTISPECIES: glycerophosphodiester phosphodiesterase [unclassified Arthrobacter]PRA13367.1 hypothetical protein CQ015_03845 [Arthrobacter sp. MYb221]PRC10564.1 hypothetical protein CQ010_01590 [Arthrobacter sp. MYb211]